MTFITAEIGCNWMGDPQVLRYLLQACKRMGVDAVKFQSLSDELLERHCEIPYIEQASVTEENIESIDKVCKEFKMEWYCTINHPDHVKFLDPYVNKYKIKRASYQNKELKDAAFNTGKTVIISSHVPQKHDSARIINLYCPKEYPLSYSDINFDMIKRMDGFSNHCQNALAVFRAVEFGAKYLEIHMVPTKDIFLLDNNIAFTPPEFNEIVKWVRWYSHYKLKKFVFPFTH